ncbi:hypothetical protein SAMN04488591_3120 [Microbacterium azadirachtae]|uniref:Uncharacterized protein n=1 Tax=Microbacterium azadirachtae TaxID=582680 RepID=A0A1I6IYJ3_9MICO|nr:hypothetical protein [Microbacterium azadirachtae]SFR71763.1 hypothetical protein SAMN04488591_3120 [Microbacterium azadirachtae]
MNLVVLELQRSDYRDLNMHTAMKLGRALAELPEAIGVWIAEDGNPVFRGIPRLQFAVMGSASRRAAETVRPSIARLEKESRERLSIAYSTRRPDAVPPSIARQLGIDAVASNAKIVSILKQPQG